jgi:ribosomal protein S12 methylthiotransferase
VADSIKQERKEHIEALQRAITSERYERFLGVEARVLVERVSEVAGEMLCRAPWQADDIDGLVHVPLNAAAGIMMPGMFAEVRMEQVVDDYDFRATLLRVADQATAPMRRASRTLPLVGSGIPDSSSVGSFGR